MDFMIIMMPWYGLAGFHDDHDSLIGLTGCHDHYDSLIGLTGFHDYYDSSIRVYLTLGLLIDLLRN